MIGVTKRSALMFSIEGKDDFLTTEDFNSLLIVEEAGNISPTFECNFNTRDKTLLKQLNEGNLLYISLGKDPETLETSIFWILGKVIETSGANGYNITLRGLLSPFNYNAELKTRYFAKQSGVQVIQSVAGESWVPDTNTGNSQDNQTWYQYGISDKQFINELWVRSYLSGSFLGLGISTDHKFIIRDMKKLFQQEPLWKFVSSEPKGDKEIAYQYHQPFASNTGFLNAYAGYRTNVPIYDLDTGQSTIELVNTKVMLAQSRFLDRCIDIPIRKTKLRHKTENMHSKYYYAQQSNLMNLSLFSTGKIAVKYEDQFILQRVLDICHLYDKDINVPGTTSADAYSGKFIISKIARNYSQKSVVTVVEMCRESLADTKGDLV